MIYSPSAGPTGGPVGREGATIVVHRHAAAGEYHAAVVRLEQASDALIALIRSYGYDLP